MDSKNEFKLVSKAKKVDFKYIATVENADVQELCDEAFITIPGEPSKDEIDAKITEYIMAQLQKHLKATDALSDIELKITLNVDVKSIQGVEMHIDIKR
jgi:hypothetical protein